jgi:hypothetical protein
MLPRRLLTSASFQGRRKNSHRRKKLKKQNSVVHGKLTAESTAKYSDFVHASNAGGRNKDVARKFGAAWRRDRPQHDPFPSGSFCHCRDLGQLRVCMRCSSSVNATAATWKRLNKLTELSDRP